MITAAEARRTTKASLSDEEAEDLMNQIEDRIRRVAEAGHSSLKIEDNLSDVKKEYLRKKLKDQGFELSETGLIIYW